MNANEPAFPRYYGDGTAKDGLTKREWFAGLALQGLFSGMNFSIATPEIAKMSVEAADALLAELEKTK